MLKFLTYASIKRVLYQSAIPALYIKQWTRPFLQSSGEKTYKMLCFRLRTTGLILCAAMVSSVMESVAHKNEGAANSNFTHDTETNWKNRWMPSCENCGWNVVIDEGSLNGYNVAKTQNSHSKGGKEIHDHENNETSKNWQANRKDNTEKQPLNTLLTLLCQCDPENEGEWKCNLFSCMPTNTVLKCPRLTRQRVVNGYDHSYSSKSQSLNSNESTKSFPVFVFKNNKQCFNYAAEHTFPTDEVAGGQRDTEQKPAQKSDSREHDRPVTTKQVYADRYPNVLDEGKNEHEGWQGSYEVRDKPVSVQNYHPSFSSKYDTNMQITDASRYSKYDVQKYPTAQPANPVSFPNWIVPANSYTGGPVLQNAGLSYGQPLCFNFPPNICRSSVPCYGVPNVPFYPSLSYNGQ